MDHLKSTPHAGLGPFYLGLRVALSFYLYFRPATTGGYATESEAAPHTIRR